jgi:hypothetical protein
MWPRSTQTLRIIIILLFLVNTQLYGTIISSTQCGNWTDVTTWNLSRIPISTDTILIRHFVSFDTSFVSESPGILHVEKSGTLCGMNQYEGHFWFEGPVYLGSLIHYYGESVNDSLLSVWHFMRVTGSGSYSVHFRVHVGDSTDCSNCTAIPIPGKEDPKDTTITVLPTCEVSFPNLLIKENGSINQYLLPTCSSTIHPLSLKIYNRWGKMVYENTDDSHWWNGVDNVGQDLTDGIYYYAFTYQFLPPVTIKSNQSLNGWVELIHVQ